MNQAEEIKRLFRELVPTPVTIVTGSITAVDGESCTIKISSDLELPDVRLKASVNESDNYLLRSPQIGSFAIAGSITGGHDDLFIIQCDEYEFIEYTQDGLLFRIDSKTGKVTLKNEQTNLYDLFTSLSDIIKNITVSTPNGPSGTPLPPTLSAVQQFETAFKQLLNQ